MRDSRKKLIQDAKDAGYTVRTDDDGTVEIFKSRGTHITRGLSMWPNGTATRMDTDLTVCGSIRRLVDMRAVLGL